MSYHTMLHSDSTGHHDSSDHAQVYISDTLEASYYMVMIILCYSTSTAEIELSIIDGTAYSSSRACRSIHAVLW